MSIYINSLDIRHLEENTMSEAQYIESKIDNKIYCKSNGQFARHLKVHNLTNKDYYETYIIGYTPLCLCGKSLTYYRDDKYANSCGDVKCVGQSVSKRKSQWTLEEKQKDSSNKKLAASRRTADDIKQTISKTKETFIRKYGTEWVTQSTEFKTKSAKSKIERYGNSKYNNSQTSQIKNKNKSIDEKNLINNTRRNTNLELYGVENCFLKPDARYKSAKSNSAGREFVMPSGKIIRVRGYEDQVITELSLTFDESDLIVDDVLHLYNLPVFTYVDHRRHIRKYYPDIYIPKENKIIEVKSRWWWDGNGSEKYKTRLTNNLKKRQAVLDKGYNYEVWLFTDKNNYKILTHDSDFQA